jgi:hypothetical protein
MAIRELGPTPADSRTNSKANSKANSKVSGARRLALVTPMSNLGNLTLASLTDEKRDSKNFVMICVSIATAGLMAMFMLNIALTEGAFTVRALKLEVIEMKELRQASQTELAHISSPDRLARSAGMLGMVASGSPRFIEIQDR